jgi:hypothetical protein
VRRGLIAVLAVAMIACGGGGGPSKKSGAQASKSPPPPPRAALTGLIVTDQSVLGRPALAIKVENSSSSLPQVGLQLADVVYEQIAEGGITRFIAVYQSKTCNQVIPVRSARLMDANILLSMRAWLAYSGAHPVVENALVRSKLPLIRYGAYPNAFSRTSSRRAPHNLVTTCPALWKIAKGAPPPAGFLTFAEQPPVLPSPVASVSGSPSASPSPSAVSRGTGLNVKFSDSQTSMWRYDGTKDAYLRLQGGTKHVLADGSQVNARNVLVLYVKLKDGGYLDPAGNPAYDAVVTGSGKALLFRNGLKVTGTWAHPSAAQLMTFTDSTGRAMTFAPGNTWVELVPDTGSVSSS